MGAIRETRRTASAQCAGGRTIRTLALGACLLAAAPLAPAQVGATFETLTTRAATYQNVKVLSANASTITIKHAGGIAQVPLKQLPPEVQARFGYDPARDAALENEIAASTQAQLAAVQKRAAEAEKAKTENRSARAIPLFGKPAPVQPVDLRGEYRALDFGAKSQGARPSCAIFAVVGALELESSRATGRLERLSEDYLIWATRRVTGRAFIRANNESQNALLQRIIDDIGFSLKNVLDAASTYGVALESEIPEAPDARMSELPPPAPEVVERAKHYRRISVRHVPGETHDVQLENIRHLLHAGVPVLAGIHWPSLRSDRGAEITADDSPGGGGHAVTLVGYTSPTGRREDIRFIFRNSWGRDWGHEGYGTIEYEYLRRYLGEAAVIEVERGAAK